MLLLDSHAHCRRPATFDTLQGKQELGAGPLFCKPAYAGQELPLVMRAAGNIRSVPYLVLLGHAGNAGS